ncbi:hypothetical protein [Legionella sp. PC997]|uniref:hypothetical protein n=1 Tax=Legionella sp. PC997 TaxID=2755562 RepID=UPI0015FC580C|nr:hypothetical protein [Legionella sp. PC997]QMT58677.1 hypothetical protein HBNCFIEN_00030 [Legionella sp. PC997]
MESSIEIKDRIKTNKNTNGSIIRLEPEYASYLHGYPGAYGFNVNALQELARGDSLPINNLEHALYNTKAIVTELNGGVEIAFVAEEDCRELKKILEEVPQSLWSLTFEPQLIMQQIENSLSQGPNFFEEQRTKYDVQQEHHDEVEEVQSKPN